MKDDFGSRLSRALSAKGWKQSDLAEAAGFSDARISQWIHNKYLPNAEGLNRIAETLGVSETWLMGNDTATDCGQAEMAGYGSCELFGKCHGQEACVMVGQFLKLDNADRIRIAERISTLLENEKYTTGKEP